MESFTCKRQALLVLQRIRSGVEQQSPELVLVAPSEVRAAALSALLGSAATVVAPQDDKPPQADTARLARPRRGSDLERFAFLADAPEPERERIRLAWWIAVTTAAAVGAAAPVLLALSVR